MSDIRRQRQADRLGLTKPSVFTAAVYEARKYWKQLLLVLGIGSLPDKLKDYLTAKVMDWLASKLGPVWIFVLGYPIAFFSLTLTGILVWLLVAAIRETQTHDTGLIDPIHGVPIQRRNLPTQWVTGFAVFVMVSVVVLAYGIYSYSRLKPLLSEFPLGYVVMDLTW